MSKKLIGVQYDWSGEWSLLWVFYSKRQSNKVQNECNMVTLWQVTVTLRRRRIVFLQKSNYQSPCLSYFQYKYIISNIFATNTQAWNKSCIIIWKQLIYKICCTIRILFALALVSYLHLKSRLDIPAWWLPVLLSVLEL